MNWWYLSPFHGQHVFFYSRAGLDWIANHFHYRYVSLPSLHAFVTDEVWEDPDLAGFREQLQSLGECPVDRRKVATPRSRP